MLSDRIPVRVIADFGADYLVEDGESTRRAAARRCDPAVGDWVNIDGDFIVGVLPRRTVFSRRAAGAETREQVLAANIDVVFVVAAAIDVNERRLERYLTIAWQSGATPVVVITKADLVSGVEEPALATPVFITSVVTGAGIDDVRAQLNPSKTGVLLGPSGVGKSTRLVCARRSCGRARTPSPECSKTSRRWRCNAASRIARITPSPAAQSRTRSSAASWTRIASRATASCCASCAPWR